MLNSTMLYRGDGKHKIHDGMYDYVVVPDDEVETMLSEGWFRTTTDAKAAVDSKKAELAAAAQEAARVKALEDARALIAQHEAEKLEELGSNDLAGGESLEDTKQWARKMASVLGVKMKPPEEAEDNSPPTKAELQQRLTELGIPFHHKAGVKALTALLPKD